MPKIKILISLVFGLVMTAELQPAQATNLSGNSSSVSVSSATVASRAGHRRRRVLPKRSGGGRGGFGRATPSIFPPANPPAAGGSRCTAGRGGMVCR